MDRRTFVAGIGTFLITPKAFTEESVLTISDMLSKVASKNTVMATGGTVTWTAFYQLLWSFSEIKHDSGDNWVGKNTSNKTIMYNSKMAKQISDIFAGFNVNIEPEELKNGFTIDFSSKRTTQETSYPQDDLNNPKHRYLHLEEACLMTFSPSEELPDDVILMKDEASGEYGKVVAGNDPFFAEILKKQGLS